MGRFPNWPQNRTATQVSTPFGPNPNGQNFYHPGVVSSNSNLMSQYAVSSERNSLYNEYRPPNFDNSIGQNPQPYVASYFRHPPPSTTIQRPFTNQPNFHENYLNDIHSAGSSSFEPSLENGLDINTPSYFNEYQFNQPNIGAYDTSTFGNEHHFPTQFPGYPHQFQTPYPQQHNFPPQYPPHHPPPHPGPGYSVLNGGYFDGGNSGEHHTKEEFPGLAGFGKKISKLINDFIDPDKDKHKKGHSSHHNKNKGGKYGDSLFGALTGFNDNKKINYKKIFGFGHG